MYFYNVVGAHKWAPRRNRNISICANSEQGQNVTSIEYNSSLLASEQDITIGVDEQPIYDMTRFAGMYKFRRYVIVS